MIKPKYIYVTMLCMLLTGCGVGTSASTESSLTTDTTNSVVLIGTSVEETSGTAKSFDSDEISQEVNNSDNINDFAETYERLNSGVVHEGTDHEYTFSDVYINRDLKIKHVTYDEAIQMHDSGETFYLYFGFPDCPYCRNSIPAISNVFAEKGETLYVISLEPDYWNTMRTTYEIKDKEAVCTYTNANYDKFLSDFGHTAFYRYILTDDETGQNIDAGVQRMSAPSLIYVTHEFARNIRADEFANQPLTMTDEQKAALESAISDWMDNNKAQEEYYNYSDKTISGADLLDLINTYKNKKISIEVNNGTKTVQYLNQMESKCNRPLHQHLATENTNADGLNQMLAAAKDPSDPAYINSSDQYKIELVRSEYTTDIIGFECTKQ